MPEIDVKEAMRREGKKAIIIGTSTGVGRALAFKLSREGFEVGLAGRSAERLRDLQKELPGKTYVQELDVRLPEEAASRLKGLIQEMEGLDLLIVNAGVRYPNLDLKWEPENETFKVNAAGFVAMALVGMRYFLSKEVGHLVGISSIAALRGAEESPAYNATKAFMSNYLDGLRLKTMSSSIHVTDIRLGFVRTEMIRGRKSSFLAVTPERGADLIYKVIQKKAKLAYVPLRWLFLCSIFQSIPEPLNYWLYWKFTDRRREANETANPPLRSENEIPLKSQ